MELHWWWLHFYYYLIDVGIYNALVLYNDFLKNRMKNSECG